MVPRLGKLLCALAVFQLLGGPLAALQTFAWVRMAFTYSQSDGVGEGIAKTFDGQHTCSLCKEIAKKRDGQQKDFGDLSLIKIYLQCAATPDRLLPPTFYWLRRLGSASGNARALEPLLQPPKFA
jgi:hypothetical protein